MKNFDKQFGQQVINNLYAVFLGIVLSATFNVDTKKGIIDFALNANWIALIMLVIYYLLDWFSSVFTIRNDERINYLHLYLFVFANIILCMSILLAIKDSCVLFIVFGVYSFIVPFWDFFVSANNIEKNGNIQSIQQTEKLFDFSSKSLRFQLNFVTSFRFVFGIVLLLISSLSYLFFGKNNLDAQIMSYFILFFIVFTKWVRMYILFQSYSEHEVI